jgi:hypothetical protein
MGTQGGLQEILSHPWLSGLDTDKIVKKQIPAPFKPQLSADIDDISNFDKVFTKEEVAFTAVNPDALQEI